MQVLQLFSLCLLLGATSYVHSFDICAAGKIYSAAELALNPGCSSCGSYLQCLGNRNAVTKCGLISQSDAVATALIISYGAEWASYVATYLNIAADTTAAAFGQNGGDCENQYGSSFSCNIPAVMRQRKPIYDIEPFDPTCFVPSKFF